jgi:hypothetical protein
MVLDEDNCIRKSSASPLPLLVLSFLFLHVLALDAFGLTVISPNGGEVLASGASVDIIWDNPEGAATFNLMYSSDGGSSWTLIEGNITETTYHWTVPAPRSNRGKCLVKVMGLDSTGRKRSSDKSDSYFRIEVVKLMTPNGGEIFKSGDIVGLTWQINKTTTDVAQIIFYYSVDNGMSWQRKGKTPAGLLNSADWKVPWVDGVKFKSLFKIMLQDAAGNAIGTDQSDNVFTMTNGTRYEYYVGDITFWIDDMDPDTRVTTETWAQFGGDAFGQDYSYENCPEYEPVRGFWMAGKNRTSGIKANVSHMYGTYCGWWCICESKFLATYPLVLGYNILSLQATNWEGYYTKVLETIKRIPLTPTGVAVSPGDSQNTITWDSVPEATSYNIYWSTSYPVTKKTANKIRNVTSPYTHSGLINGTTYYYVVTAYGANVESEVSETAVGVAGWATTIIDSIPDTALSPHLSMAVDTAGKVHVRHSSHVDVDPYYYQRYITNASGSWETLELAPTSDGALALDRNENVHIAYANRGTVGGITYSVKTSEGWSQEVIAAGQYSISSISLALDSNDQPHIVYSHGFSLMHAAKLGGNWTFETIYTSSSIYSFSPGLADKGLAIDGENNLHIVFSSGYPDYDVMYATNRSGIWESSTIDNSGYIVDDYSLSVDSVGQPHVTYECYSSSGECDGLKYAANASGIWSTSVLDYYAFGASLAIDKDNRLHISYIKGGELRYMNDRLGFWQNIVIDMISPVTYNNSTIATDATTSAHIVYYDYILHKLKYATNRLTP